MVMPGVERPFGTGCRPKVLLQPVWFPVGLKGKQEQRTKGTTMNTTNDNMVTALETLHIVLSSNRELEDVGASFIRNRHRRMSPHGAAMVVALAAHNLASRGGEGIITHKGALIAVDDAYTTYKASSLADYDV